MSLLLLFKSAAAVGTRSLTLTPDSLFPPVGSIVNVTATLLDEDGLPLVAKTIYFDVTGANTANGSDPTDVNGEATFQYTITNDGTDIIRARWGKATGLNLLSMDRSTDRVYEHDGFSTTILTSFVTPGTSHAYVAWDGDNAITVEGQIVYQHTGMTATVQDSFDAGATVLGIAWDGTNVLVATGTTVAKHLGFSSTVQQSVSLPGLSISGIGWDGENLLVAHGVNLADDEVRRYVGFSAVLDQTLTMPYSHTIAGVAWDGDNLVTAAEDTGGSGNDFIYLHDGYSATVGTTINSPSSQIRGVGWTEALMATTSVTASKVGLGVLGRRTARVVP